MSHQFLKVLAAAAQLTTDEQQHGRPSTVSVRKALKVLGSPRLAAALINAQVHLRGKAKVPLSVRLKGRIMLAGERGGIWERCEPCRQCRSDRNRLSQRRSYIDR
jgi:hypothetical protein